MYFALGMNKLRELVVLGGLLLAVAFCSLGLVVAQPLSPDQLRVRGERNLLSLPPVTAQAPTWRQGQAIEPLSLAPLFELGATSYSVTELPAGLSITEGMISGVPESFTGVYGDTLVIRARNAEYEQDLLLQVFIEPQLVSALSEVKVDGSSHVSVRRMGPDMIELVAKGTGNFSLGYPLDTSVCGRCRFRYRVFQEQTTGRFNVMLRGSNDRGYSPHQPELEGLKIGDRLSTIGELEFASLGGARHIRLFGQNLPAGHKITIGLIEVYRPELQRPTSLRQGGVVEVPRGEFAFVPKSGAFFSATSYALAPESHALPEGLILDGKNGTISGIPSEVTSRELILLGQNGEDFATHSFTLKISEGALVYQTPQDGPRGAYYLNKGGSGGPISSGVSRIADNAWRVYHRQGEKTQLNWRLQGLTGGAKYTIATRIERGSVRRPITLRVSRSLEFAQGGVALQQSTEQDGVLEASFTAPNNNPWVTISTDAQDGEFFIVRGLRVIPHRGEEPVTGGGFRVDRGGSRLFNLEFSKRYELQAPGEVVKISKDAEGRDVIATISGIGTFYAEAEILYLHGGANVQVRKLPEQTWPPSRLPVSPQARFPFTEPYPSLPSEINFVVGGDHPGAVRYDSLLSALSAARGGENILIKSGHTDPGGDLRNTDYEGKVTVVAEEQYGATIGTLIFRGGQDLELRGLRVYGVLLFLEKTKNIVVRHNLFTRGGRVETNFYGEHFDFTLANNDFVGGPVTGIVDVDRAEDYNPMNFPIALNKTYGCKVYGNRVLFAGEDTFRGSGQFLLLERNLFFETFSHKDAHTDSVQWFQHTPRNSSWMLIRDNVIVDNVLQNTGISVQTGIWGGDYTAGLVGIYVENNIIDTKNPTWGIGMGDAIRDYRILNNSVNGEGKIIGYATHVGTQQATIKGNVARSAQGTGWFMGGVDETKNFFYYPADSSSIWERPETYYGYALQSEHPAMGAQKLAQDLADDYGPPSAFGSAMWRLNSEVAGEFEIELYTLPHGADPNHLGLEYQVNGGSWQTLDINFPFSFTKRVRGLSSGTYRVRLRSQVDGMQSSASMEKSVVVSN